MFETNFNIKRILKMITNKLSYFLYCLLCYVIGHKIKGNVWYHIEHHHDDWFYSTECKRCGQIICRDNKPKKATIVEYEPNTT